MSKRAPHPPREPWPGSPRYWQSLEQRASLGDAAKREAADAVEFPAGHTTTPPTAEALEVGRRGLLGAMAATFALVGAEGCRRPVEKVVPYVKMPEDVIPGVPSHYATVIQRRGDALGVLVESHEGRPTKIEGNDAHPSSAGAADLIAQATILDLYDPERSTNPRKGSDASTWAEFDREFEAKLKEFEKNRGATLRVLMQPTLSPSVLRMRAELLKRFPDARVHTWTAASDSNAREGTRVAFGQPLEVLPAYDRAKCILALDSDFLQTETASVRATRSFANGRRLRKSGEPMSRLYVVEPARTTTGNSADHRLRLPASDVERYALALAAELAKNGLTLGELAPVVAAQGNGAEGIPPKWLSEVAKDLMNSRGRALVVVGSRQPPTLHALAHALNAALGSVGATVTYAPVADPDEKSAGDDIKDLIAAMAAPKKVEGLVIIDGNPVYDAPADLGFAEKLASVGFSVHASLFVDETSQKTTWHIPLAHEYEAWGDARAVDGTVAVRQPLIAPLYAGRSEVELVAQLAGVQERNGHRVVRATGRALLLARTPLVECGPFDAAGNAECHDATGKSRQLHVSDFEHEWNRALGKGTIQRPVPAQSPDLKAADIAVAIGKRKAPARAGEAALEVTFAPCPKMFDGRHANNTWLQELPDSITKLVWDNAAILSPGTAQRLGLKDKDFVNIALAGRSIVAAVWTVPGQADNSVALTLGWGRTAAGRIGNGRGFNVYPLRTSDGLGYAVGAQLTKGSDPNTHEDQYFFAQTQEHNSTEGRPIVHEATVTEYRSSPNFPQIEAPPPRSLPLWSQQDYSKGHQWGMAIDLNACTGCNACAIACIAENNVPVVGKREVWRGREMHWLRIDRYYVEKKELGATADDPLVIYEPVACVHCEEAPCENVCPVNATTHGPEGLNEMAYNRCIGTRYCANNCPYKVRRFNYLNWHNDSVWAPTDGLPETMQMQQNPNVTVRFRGIMEKCTYCVQRIQSAKIRAKREYKDVQDGDIKTACQQTCPAEAIYFGDVNDPRSNVTRWSQVDRRFGLLAELGTRPRTTYLAKVRNPNPEMV